MRTFTNKIITIITALVCLTNVFVITLGAEVKQTEVLFVCKVESGIETDNYSDIVVKLLNEDTLQTSTYILHKYNNFMERYVMDDGQYSIIYAYVSGRADVIFEVKSDKVFEVGHINNIYFELKNSGSLSGGKTTTTKVTKNNFTTQTTSNTTSSDKEELSTLFPILTTNSDKTEKTNTTDIDITDNNTDKTGRDTTNNTSITNDANKETNSEISTNITETTTQPNEEIGSFQKRISKIFIISFIVILFGIIVFGIIYTKKNKE